MQTQETIPSAKLRAYPFAAIVGHSIAKHALLLLAVDRHLKGLLLASASGTAKSVLSRAAQVIFQDSNAKPSATPFVEVPQSVTVDRLLGGLDFEQSLVAGRKHFTEGLLAQADGGVLLVDDIHLVDGRLLTHIAAALDTGTVAIERDGLSLATGADFVLLGVAHSRADRISSLLRQRVGLIVDSESLLPLDERTEIIRRVDAYQTNPEDFINQYEAENRQLLKTIALAKARLPFVNLAADDLQRLAAVSVELGVEGNQADIYAARAAKASAALAGHESVNEADLITAIRLVLLPRADKIPARLQAPEPQPAEPDRPEPEPAPQNPDSKPAQNHDTRDQDSADYRPDDSTDDTPERAPQRLAVGALEDLMIRAMETQLPEQALWSEFRNRQTVGSFSPGRGAATVDSNSGRYVSNSGQKNEADRVAIAATLRAAAPFQLARRKRAVAEQPVIKIAAADLRYKRFRKKSAMLFIFAVDASGSMALNRMAQAKGAMTRLLQEAYIHRDKVSLISFRKDAAELLLPPTRSMVLAKRVVDAIPTGGATPMAAAMLKALEVAKRSQAAEISQTLLVLFTDGRANAGLRVEANAAPDVRTAAIQNELRQLGATLQMANIDTLVIDTKARFMAGGEARELAETIGANYCYLPRASDKTIYDSVSKLAKSLRNSKDSNL